MLVRTLAGKGLRAQGAQKAGSLALAPSPPQVPSGTAMRWSPWLLLKENQGQSGVHAAGAGQGARYQGSGSCSVASAKAKVTPAQQGSHSGLVCMTPAIQTPQRQGPNFPSPPCHLPPRDRRWPLLPGEWH